MKSQVLILYLLLQENFINIKIPDSILAKHGNAGQGEISARINQNKKEIDRLKTLRHVMFILCVKQYMLYFCVRILDCIIFNR